jgi:acyl carrier protein
MDENKELELEIKALIIEALVLENVRPDEIDADAPLFGEGLGLDSIDALEIAMAIEERFGVVADDDPDANRERFASVRSLANFVAQGGGLRRHG